MMGCGPVVTKYTGARGKSGSNDASAEYMAEIRQMLDSANIVWQTGELGAVDVGGGGTVAKYIANMKKSRLPRLSRLFGAKIANIVSSTRMQKRTSATDEAILSKKQKQTGFVIMEKEKERHYD